MEANSTIENLVSVVVPTHNRAHLVCEALQSIYDQTYRPLELIVVDDGSTDDTRKVVTNWIEQHNSDGFSVRYECRPKRGGSDARNHGIKLARGQYVGFLDSDDTWHRDKIQRQVAEFKNNPENGGVYCGLRHIDLKTGKVTSTPHRNYPTGRLLGDLLIKDVTAPTSTYLLRREVFDEVGYFDETLHARQDWDLWIRMAEKYPIGCVADCLVDFREHDGPRTISDPNREIRAYQTILNKYEHLHKNCSWITRRKIQASYFRRMGRVHFHQKISRLRAAGYYLTSLYFWPFTFDTYAALLGMFVPAPIRGHLNRAWNRVFGKTFLAIRSH